MYYIYIILQHNYNIYVYIIIKNCSESVKSQVHFVSVHKDKFVREGTCKVKAYCKLWNIQNSKTRSILFIKLKQTKHSSSGVS